TSRILAVQHCGSVPYLKTIRNPITVTTLSTSRVSIRASAQRKILQSWWTKRINAICVSSWISYCITQEMCGAIRRATTTITTTVPSSRSENGSMKTNPCHASCETQTCTGERDRSETSTAIRKHVKVIFIG